MTNPKSIHFITSDSNTTRYHTEFANSHHPRQSPPRSLLPAIRAAKTSIQKYSPFAPISTNFVDSFCIQAVCRTRICVPFSGFEKFIVQCLKIRLRRTHVHPPSGVWVTPHLVSTLARFYRPFRPLTFMPMAPTVANAPISLIQSHRSLTLTQNIDAIRHAPPPPPQSTFGLPANLQL